MPRTRPGYPPEFRQQIVELVRVGRSPTELAREFKVSPLSIRMWVAQSERKAAKRNSSAMSAVERSELNRLRKENHQLRIEREILAKAAAWFAQETLKIRYGSCADCCGSHRVVSMRGSSVRSHRASRWI
jgi:transposase